jgi:hypothetical protein
MALTASIDLTVKKPDFKSMKAEIKELTIAAQQAVMQFGEFSPEAMRAEQALAQARDRMEDFNDRIAAVNPDKFAQINTVVQGVARGFQAAQGAMALFGTESDDLQKTMVKLQGAMALAEGLEGLGKVQQQFGALANLVKGKVVAAFSTLRGAIMATGLGALAIALGYVVTNFDKVSKAVLNFIPGLAKVGEIVGNLVQRFTDFVGITSAAERAYKSFSKEIVTTNEDIQGQIDLLTVQGEQELKIFELRKKIINNQLALIQKRRDTGVKLTEDQLEEEARLYRELNNKLKIVDAERDKFTEEKEKKDEEKRKERQKRLQDIDNQIEDEKLKKRLVNSKDEFKRLDAEQTAQITQLSRWYVEQLALAEGNKEEIQKLDRLYAEKSYANEAEFNQKRVELNKKADQQIMDAKLSMAKSTVDGLTSLNTILTNEEKKRENIQKGIALVEIAIDSAVAFSGLNAESAQASAKVAGILGPATPLFTAAYYAQGVARILANVAKAKQILSGGSGQGQMVGGTPIALNPNTIISSSLPTETGVGFPTRVFVTEGDISRTQARVGNTKRVSVVK